MRKIFDIENKLIKAIHESREKMITSFTLGDLESEYLDLIEELYFKANTTIKGEQAKKLSERLRQGRQAAAENETMLLDLYAAETAKAVEEFTKLKEKVLESFVSGQKPKEKERALEIDSRVLKQSLAVVEEDLKKYSKSTSIGKYADALLPG